MISCDVCVCVCVCVKSDCINFQLVLNVLKKLSCLALPKKNVILMVFCVCGCVPLNVCEYLCIENVHRIFRIIFHGSFML